MNPAREAEDLLTRSSLVNSASAQRIAEAQVYATLALANAIEGIGIDIKEVLQTTNAELGAISISLGER